jgi:hypothetical protein
MRSLIDSRSTRVEDVVVGLAGEWHVENQVYAFVSGTPAAHRKWCHITGVATYHIVRQMISLIATVI